MEPNVRLAAQGWVVALVVRDILRPASDPMRRNGHDDPTGGVLDGAPDADWVRELQSSSLRPSRAR